MNIMKFKKILLNKKKRKPLLYSAGALFLLIILILAIFFRDKVISCIFTLLLIVLGSMSSQFKRMFGDINLGLEFVPFATIIFFYTHGIVFGLLAALLMITVSALLVGQLQFDMFISVGIFAIIGLLSLFINFGIVTSGIILMIVFNVLSLILMIVLGLDVAKNIIYFFGSLLFNYILFKYFSEFIAKALGLA